MRAWFAGAAFARHRHDSYAIGVTECGVQRFWYRGSVRDSTPGDVVVLHPDELHDGYAGTRQGFGYRIVYLEPALIAQALAGMKPRRALPFVAQPVLRSEELRTLIRFAHDVELEPLACDAIVLKLAEALCRASGGPVPEAGRRIDLRAVERARELIHRTPQRPLRSGELEAASGLSRFALARQFRARFAASPYRYALMRRLEWARERLGPRPLAQLALDAGFSDQAHFTRAFRGAFGLPPGRYLALVAATRSRR